MKLFLKFALAALLVAWLAFPSLAQRQQQNRKSQEPKSTNLNVEPPKKNTGSRVPPYTAKGESSPGSATSSGGKTVTKNEEAVREYLRH
jgi:hypothetical protein